MDNFWETAMGAEQDISGKDKGQEIRLIVRKGMLMT